MVQKAQKTLGHVTTQRPMTDEEKQQRIMQILTQKRENFSLSILSGMVQKNLQKSEEYQAPGATIRKGVLTRKSQRK